MPMPRRIPRRRICSSSTRFTAVGLRACSQPILPWSSVSPGSRTWRHKWAKSRKPGRGASLRLDPSSSRPEARAMSAPVKSMSQPESVPGYAARKAAVAILSDVLRRKRPLDVAAAEALAAANVPPRDAGFAGAIATTSLRRFGQLEALIRQFVPKSPPPHKAGPTLEILLAGACELLFLGVAPHAAVDAANRLAQSDAKAVHFKALINAVLRRVAKEGEAAIAAQDAGVLNTPDWLWPRWVANYGEETARAIAAAHLPVPPLDLTLKSLDDPPTDLIGERLAPGRLRLNDSGRIEELHGVHERIWWVQDLAATLPARVFADTQGRTEIHLCA